MAPIGSLLNLANGAALGTGPGAIAQAAGSDDEGGQIQMSAGTGTVAGILCTFNLGTSYSDNNARIPIIVVNAASAGAAAAGVIYPTVVNGNTVTITCTAAPTVSVACNVNYIVIT